MLLLIFLHFRFLIQPSDEQVCPSDPDTSLNRSYYGWLTSLYFASTTMSTVGTWFHSVHVKTQTDCGDNDLINVAMLGF